MKVRLARNSDTDVNAAKTLADTCRNALGFIARTLFVQSAEKGELLLAFDGEQILGFVRFHRRKDWG